MPAPPLGVVVHKGAMTDWIGAVVLLGAAFLVSLTKREFMFRIMDRQNIVEKGDDSDSISIPTEMAIVPMNVWLFSTA